MLSPKKIIVFFTPPTKFIGGGVISIFSLAAESRALQYIHGSDVLISVFPGHKTYGKNDLFANNEDVWDFEQVIATYPDLDQLVMHIPEYAVPEVEKVLQSYKIYLDRIDSVWINILNQNIKLMPERLVTSSLFLLTPQITQSTAHEKYASEYSADYYYMPTHHMSVFIDKSQYTYKSYADKDNIIAVSPDGHPLRTSVINKLKKKLPAYEVIEIKDLSYDEYKNLIARAKFSITFGEGMDGYYIEPIFSGSIGFTVYNSDFFDDETFLALENVYESYDALIGHIVQDINELDNPNTYPLLNKRNLEKLQKIYSRDRYITKIKKFYLQEFDYIPSQYAGQKLAVDLSREIMTLRNDKEISKEKIEILQSTLTHKENVIQELVKEQELIQNSHSWKITKPVRGVVNWLKNR